ncbi:hypothetical protein B5P43_34720 [Bacillus sp. SRB_336]|nr:hypothetical protein B5P43_34720 [Bacillus sp. SRB_336]
MSLYSTGTRVLASVAWAFCAFFALNLLLTGTAASVWHFLPSLVLAAWAVFLLLWRPRLMVGADGLTVVNILRSHRIPFGALKAVRVAQSVSLDTTSKRIPSWGAPGSGRLGPRLGGRPGGSNRLPATAHTQAAIEAAWNAWEQAEKDSAEKRDSAEKDRADGVPSAGDAPQAVATRWDVGHGVVSLVLLAVVAVSVAG